MKLNKAIIKKHKGNLKAAWAEIRGKKKSQSVTVSKPANSGKGAKVAKRKKSASHTAKRAVHHVKKAAATRPGQLLVQAAMAAAGGVGTSFILNKAPMVKDMSKGAKAGAQLALGLAGVFLFKNKILKAASTGAVIAGVFSGVKAFTGLDPLAGESGRKLSPMELLQLTKGGMGVPVNYKGLGKPVAYTGLGRTSMPSLNVTGWGDNGWR